MLYVCHLIGFNVITNLKCDFKIKPGLCLPFKNSTLYKLMSSLHLICLVQRVITSKYFLHPSSFSYCVNFRYFFYNQVCYILTTSLYPFHVYIFKNKNCIYLRFISTKGLRHIHPVEAHGNVEWALHFLIFRLLFQCNLNILRDISSSPPTEDSKWRKRGLGIFYPAAASIVSFNINRKSY